VSDDITLLLAIEARDKASQILDTVMGKLGGFGNAAKAASAQAARSAEEIESAQMRAAAAVASLERAQQAQAAAQNSLSVAMGLSKDAQVAAAAAAKEGAAGQRLAADQVRAAADLEEQSLIKLQESERLVAARSTEMAAAQAAASTEVASSGAVMKGVAIGAGAVALAVGYIGEKAIKSAGDFQASTTRLVTSAGEITSNVGMVRQGMLQMAGDVGYSTDALSTAMYKVESGGEHGAAGLQVLRAAAEGAKTENADLTKVADAVTSVLVDYHLKAEDAATVTSKLVAATSAGKTTFEELAAAMPAILPVASAAHVSLNDILGDLASMTVHGMSAQQAAQNLADVIRHMQNPTAVQAKELALLGLTTTQLADDLKTKGLSGTLQEISERIMKLSPPGTDKVILELKTALNGLSPAVRELGQHLFDGTMSAKEYAKAAQALDPISAKQALSFATLAGQTHRIGDAQMTGAEAMQNYGQALAKATGDSTGLNVALMLTGENADGTNDAIRKVAGASTEAGNHVKGWGEIQATFNYKMDALKGHLEAAKISIGMGLLPAVEKIVGVVGKVVGPIADWMSKHQTLSAVILGSLGVLGLLAAAVIAINLALGSLMANPVVLAIVGIVAAVGLLVGGLVYAYNHVKWFHDAVNAAWAGIKVGALALWHNALKPTFDGIVVAVKWVGEAAVWLWKNALVPAWHAIAEASMWLYRNVLKPAFDGISAAISFAWHNVIKPALEGWEIIFKNVIAPVVMWLWNSIIKPAWEGIKVAIKVAWDVIKVIWDVIKLEIKGLGIIFGWLYDNIIKPVWERIQLAIKVAWAVIQVIWGLIQIEIKMLAAVFHWLYENVIKPVWDWISSAISWAWHNIIKPIWELIKMGIQGLGIIFGWLYDHAIKPAWDAISSAISWAWEHVVKPVFNALGGFIKDYVVPAFHAGVDAIGSAWNRLKDLASKPIEFVVNSVINPLIQGYNKIASAFGVGTVDTIHGFGNVGSSTDTSHSFHAAGGPIWGPGTETSDSIPAWLSHNEHVWTAAEVRAAGGHAAVMELRRLVLGRSSLPKYPGDLSHGVPGFAGGGPVGGFFSDIWKAVSDPISAIKRPAEAALNAIPGGGAIRDILSSMGHKLIGGLLSFIGGGGGKGSVGSAMAFLRAQDGKPYIWASAGPDGMDCSGLLSAVYNVMHGKNPYSHTFSTMNEAPFFPLSGPGLFTAGWTNPGEPGPGGNDVGHTAGVLAGLPFESTGDRGVHMGSGVTPISSFAHVGHYDRGGPLHPGWTAAYNGTGHTEWVSAHGQGGGSGVYIDLRESKFFSTRDIDDLLDRIDKRLVRELLPGAGVQVRR
jgi:hypothetical protein